MSCKCTLCLSMETSFFYKDGETSFYRCKNCFLTFMDPAMYLSPEEELNRYGLHNNNPEDEHYRNFLSRLANPMIENLQHGDVGLDFGCGPGPALSIMFQEKGFPCRNWDPFFFPDTSALEETYNFISVSEVAEHLYAPAEVFRTLDQLLKPRGILGIMTTHLTENIDFKAWHYKNDPTHVCFYSDETFSWIAEKFNYDILESTSTVVILRKQDN